MHSTGFNFNTMHGAVPTNTTQPPQTTSAFPQAQHFHPLPQPHQMPTPTAAPWNLSAMPWKLATASVREEDVMQFSSAEAMHRRAQLHQKRKSELNALTAPPPVKQFISEEKITQHFNGLHISSDYIQSHSSSVGNGMSADQQPSGSGMCFTNLTYQDYQMTAKELEEKLRNANRITICDELIKLNEQQRKVSFLPEALLNRIEKPCTALVLWQPPPLLELLHRKQEGELQAGAQQNDTQKLQDYADDTVNDDEIDETEFSDPDPDVDIDDFIDNNNTCRVDLNTLKADGMDEDL